MSLHTERTLDPIAAAILGWPLNEPEVRSSFGEDEAINRPYDLED
jgi:hypothetical protein